MASPSSLVGPAPMEGEGGYNRSSRVQAGGSQPAVPLFAKAAQLASLPEAPEAIAIADYGASEGHNSLAPMAVAIAALRKRVGPQRAISIVHTDLPGSDWIGLFQTLQSDPDSYLRSDPATFSSGVGRSFYEQILPSGCVTLGWCSWAVQWLSRTPGPIPDHVQVSFSRDAAAHGTYNRQAAEDWRRFLSHRGRELRVGGRLVVVTMALTDARDFGYGPLLAAIYESLIDLRDRGFVSAAEVARMVIPTVGRSHADFLEPFGQSGRFAGLSVEHAEVFLGEDHIWADFERDHDKTAFGARWAAFPRASVFPTLALGLDGGRRDPRAAAFINKLESGIAGRMASAPGPMVIPLAKLVFTREKD